MIVSNCLRMRKRDTYSNIEDVEANTTHVLLGAYTFLRRPLESSNTRILDFIQVLNTFRDIDKQVRASCFGTETPDLTSIGYIPTELIGEQTGTNLEIITRVDLAIFNGSRKFLVKRLGLDVKTIVLVLRLG